MRPIIYIASFAIFAACLPEASQLLNETDRVNSDRQAKIESMISGFENEVPVPTMTVSELQNGLQNAASDYVVVDVRDEEERRVSVIPGAISQSEFESGLNSRYKNKKIVPYCTIGYRSMKYTKELKNKGLEAYNLRGSILSWVHSGAEVVSPSSQQPTKEVHVYGDKWKLAPAGYNMHIKESWLSSWF